jgi:hypothetical protein
MIGLNPEGRNVKGCGWLAPGITIPGMIDGQLWYLQVRTRRDAVTTDGRPLDKYRCLAGSKLAALYGGDSVDVKARAAIFVTEGEFDALVLSQYTPPEVAVVTMGSAGSLPGPAWKYYFAAARQILLLLDNDEAGRDSLARWQALFPAARAVQLPDSSKDVTDFRRAGGNLAEWVKLQLAAANV